MNTQPPSPTQRKRMLLIRFGNLGEIIQMMGLFKGVAETYPDLHKTILTTAPYAQLLQECPYIDEVWLDDAPKFFEFAAIKTQIQRIKQAKFISGIDCQNNQRSHWYYRLLGRNKPHWICSMSWVPMHFNAQKYRNRPFIEHIKAIGRASAIDSTPHIDLSWLKADISGFGLPERYILLFPGSNPENKAKRWPESHYFEIMHWAAEQGIHSVICGTNADKHIIHPLMRTATHLPVIELMGHTSHAQLASLARNAVMAVGNETGPMHIAAGVDCPSIVLSLSNARTMPDGRHVCILEDSRLDYLRPMDVMIAMAHVLDHQENRKRTGLF